MIYSDPNHPNLKLSNQLVDELLQADVIVLEAAVYNFGIPSTLKAWIPGLEEPFPTRTGHPRAC